VSFVANLQHVGDWLSGAVEEPGVAGATAGMTLTATISGKVTADAVIFLKTYDAQIGGYDAVQYEGVIADQGLEIFGTWTIPGNWSGTFIMIRSRGLVLAPSVYEEEKL